LTAQTVLIAALVALPLAVVAYWFRPLTGPILALSGVLYTIPSLALLSFIAPYVGTTKPASVLIALVLYALLLIIRNTLAGLNQVPPEARDAAEGMGYGRLSQLLRVELPLALPGIVTGVRLATVSTVALVTVGSLIGYGGLGDLILSGFRNNFYKAQILTGTALSISLALVLDLMLAGLGRLLTPWTRGGVR
jgi:osmoprotectant transport system permease protein